MPWKNNFKKEKERMVREANLKDTNDILRLNLDLFKKEYREFDKSLDVKWTYGKKGKDYFKRRIIGEDGFVAVAESQGKIIGYICGGMRDHSGRIKAKYAELENMIIDKKFRGKGIGSKLAKQFIEWCKDKKTDYISVSARAKNIEGINFYRTLGFKDYSLTLEIKLKK